MARKAGDTTQVTLRVPNHILSEAEMIAKLISTTGFEASPSDAMRAGIVRGFEEIAKQHATYHVSAWDGVRTTCLYDIAEDLKSASSSAKELARTHAGGRWTVFRVFARGKDEAVANFVVSETKKP